MEKILRFLNPIQHLGDRSYSTLFPFIILVLFCIVSEVFAYGIARNPMIVGVYAIFIPVSLIIYFAFREGIRGGFVATVITIIYYFYIIYTRRYTGNQLVAAMETTIILGAIYLLLSFIIGWLKQRIDLLLEREADEKRRLETIVQQMPVGVLITDDQGKVTHRNQMVDTILGTKIPLGFQIGKDALSDGKINGKSIIPSQAPLLQAITTGKSVVGKEYAYERTDGNIRHLQVSSTPILNKYNQVIAAVSIISDITIHKDLERQKDDFLSMASHELKTPITSMKMFIDLQMKHLQSVNPERALYYSKRIHDQADRLKELTNDLLDVSRIQTGKLRFSKEQFNLSEVVTDTIEGLRGTTNNHQIIEKRSKQVQVVGDRYRIYQVLVNLLTNAIKYSPEGKKIIVSIKKNKKDAVVSVQDFGRGIHKDQLTKIFDRLYQVTDPEEKTFPGLGLGLFISKEIIKRHKGKIWVESERNKGSIFSFSLPLPPKKE